MVNQKSYYAIIPANVRYDKDITPNAKLLYGEITALCNEKGYCWASNKYFAELYNVSNVSISKWISSLVAKGYIKSELEYKQGTKEILNRYLSLVNEPIKEKFNTPIKEKFKDNNTFINNTFNKDIDKGVFSENFKKYLIELENYPLCKNIPVQLTDKNLTEILKEFEFEQVIEALEIIENSRNVKSRKNLNLTIRKILKNNFGGGKEFQRDLKAFKQVYIDWYYKDNNSKPKISKNDNYAAIELFNHLKENSKTGDNEGAIKSLQSIFENWNKIEPFYQKGVELVKINTNINTIINQIKNGYGQRNNTKSIQQLARESSNIKDEHEWGF